MGSKKNYAPRVHKTVDKNNSNMAPSTYPDMQSEYMHNNPKNNHIYPIVRNICNRFVRITEEIFGTLVQYNIEDEKMVAEWVKKDLPRPELLLDLERYLYGEGPTERIAPKDWSFIRMYSSRKTSLITIRNWSRIW